MIPRFLQDYLCRDAGYYPVLTLTGPRQSGKTTLARASFPDYEYVTLEATEPRLFARDDPNGFLQRYSGPVIIDEVQQVPGILSEIQASVDEEGTSGRFVLTGSHNFLLMNQVSETLAGRCGILNLLPFSRAELERQDQPEPAGAQSLFRNRESDLKLWEAIRTGFYPRIHDQHIPPDVWLPDYIQTYIHRDVRTLANVGDLEVFERFLMLCAGRVGQLLNYSSLANDCGVSVDTARRWVSVLKTSFIIFLMEPHHSNFNKRIIKTPKMYFYDTGLACHLLRIRNNQQLMTNPQRGGIFENYVISEIAKAYHHHRQKPPLYFWRDRTGHEVDLIVEEGRRLYPVEIKSGQTATSDMLEGLCWWCKQAGVARSDATLVYGGTEWQERHGVAVRPWFAV
jgi:hypothetical protein